MCLIDVARRVSEATGSHDFIYPVMKIDAATRARVIDGAVAKLNEFYVFPETAKKMAEAMQARLKSGAYDAVTGADDFATTLTDDLQAVSHDKHLRVNFSPQALPKMDPGANPAPNPAAVAQRKAQLQRNNCVCFAKTPSGLYFQ
jgi:N-terminal domain of Peptidase_S41 in eukaryotic IRBP